METAEEKFIAIVKRAMDLHAYSKQISSVCPMLPEHVHIEPTNACNLRCIHCHQSSRGQAFTKKLGVMPLALFTKIIDEIRHYAARITLDLQGEPLLHPEITAMISCAKAAGLSVSLLTNATRLTRELADRLIEIKLDRIVFSFEGSTAEIHERVRRGSNYHATLRNILYFLKRNAETGRGTFVCMSMVASAAAAGDADAYTEYFSRLPVNTIFVNPLLSMSGGTPTSGEVDLSRYSGLKPEEIPICRLPWEAPAINCDGTVSACAVDFNAAHIVGDVNDTPLATIWNSPAMQAFRQCHIDRNFASIEAKGPLCTHCNCRFAEEYDLRETREFIARYVMRQAKVFAPLFLAAAAPEPERTADEPLALVRREYERVLGICPHEVE